MIRHLNANGKAAVGAAVAALLIVFALINGMPWASKESVADLRAEMRQRLERIESDVRDIRSHLLGRRDR